jgi:hypothetical protein
MNDSLGTLRTEAQNETWFFFLYSAQTTNRFFLGGGEGGGEEGGWELEGLQFFPPVPVLRS